MGRPVRPAGGASASGGLLRSPGPLLRRTDAGGSPGLKGLLLALALLFPAAGVGAQWPHFTVLAASADGGLLAAGGRGGEVLLIESSTGEVLDRWVLPGGGPVTALEARSDLLLAASGPEGSFWRLARGAEPQLLASAAAGPGLRAREASWRAGPPMAAGLVLEASGWSFAALPSGSVTSRRSGAPGVSWQAAGAAVTGLVLLPGLRLVTAGYDGTLVLWDPATGKELGRL